MDNPERPNDIADEFRQLGENLVQALRSAWESPERQKLQDEIEAGLDQFATTIKQEADSFQESPTGQRLKSDIEDFRQRVESGEVVDKARDELEKITSAKGGGDRA
jgi:hypothetical protein